MWSPSKHLDPDSAGAPPSPGAGPPLPCRGRAGLPVARQPRQQVQESQGSVGGSDPGRRKVWGGPRSPHFLSGQRTSRWAGREFPETRWIRNVWLTAGSGPSMQSPAEKEAGLRGPRERTGKGSLEERARGAPAAQPPKPGWALTLEGLAAMSPAQRHRHLLFGDQLEDVGAAASIFPRESVELGSRMPDPRAWTQSPEPPGVRQDRLLGVLKAAEARGRIRALRLRYIRMRAEEISLLTSQQKSARAAIRLELFLPPQLKPTRIPDPLDRQERRRVETILEEKVDGSVFPR
ncbi:protein LKAAEAR1 isoform X3 [Prionailurus bengalensis]|uniref:protein LKAAEAR1 isoform X3 n=1 Tax=Prionailurus bengalensis TaxID=37029 RepID=UPI001CA8A3E3|nr:protein LKAAEAR1 isoform X3 [Prionailurus bengalensis]